MSKEVPISKGGGQKDTLGEAEASKLFNLNRRDFLRLAGIAFLAAEAACTPTAQPIIDSLATDTSEPQETESANFPTVELASQDVLDNFELKCGPSCEGMDKESIFGWTMDKSNFVFFVDKNGDQAGRMQIEDEWIPIYGSNVGNVVIWLLPTSGVTPVAPGSSLGTAQTEIVLSYDLSPVATGEDILVQYFNPSIPNSTSNPATFSISRESTAYNGVKLAAPLQYETPTPEVEQFKTCAPENYEDCYIPAEKLFGGEYLQWLYTLSKPFDTKNFNTSAKLLNYNNGWLMYYPVEDAPHFDLEGSAPFRRDVTAGYTTYDGHQYLVMPVEFFDPVHPDKNQWVVTVHPLYNDTHEFSKDEIDLLIDIWKTKMNYTVILSRTTPEFSEKSDPLVSKSFDMYPDMVKRIDRFVDNLDTGQVRDMAALSEPGIILLNLIASSNNNGHWFE
jgi:hypothetical protein